MGKFTFDIPDEFEKQLEALGRAGEEASVCRILAAGGQKVEAEMKSQAARHRQTGDMAASIRTAKASKNDRGYFVVTRPTGKSVRVTGTGKTALIRNMEKLAYLHYGTSRQKATGIVTKVVNRSEKPALEAMQKEFNREAGV